MSAMQASVHRTSLMPLRPRHTQPLRARLHARGNSFQLLRCGASPEQRDARVAEEGAAEEAEWKRVSSSSSVLFTTVLAAGAGGLMGLLPELTGPASIAQALLILCGIVFFHELGHFSAARLQVRPVSFCAAPVPLRRVSSCAGLRAGSCSRASHHPAEHCA